MALFKEITVTEICKLNEESGSVKLLDVRTPEEFNEAHSVLAVNLPLDQISADQVEKLGFKKDEPLYIICRSGARSAAACDALTQQGFECAYNVVGGTIAWLERGYPTKK